MMKLQELHIGQTIFYNNKPYTINGLIRRPCVHQPCEDVIYEDVIYTEQGPTFHPNNITIDKTKPYIQFHDENQPHMELCLDTASGTLIADADTFDECGYNAMYLSICTPNEDSNYDMARLKYHQDEKHMTLDVYHDIFFPETDTKTEPNEEEESLL